MGHGQSSIETFTAPKRAGLVFSYKREPQLPHRVFFGKNVWPCSINSFFCSERTSLSAICILIFVIASIVPMAREVCYSMELVLCSMRHVAYSDDNQRPIMVMIINRVVKSNKRQNTTRTHPNTQTAQQQQQNQHRTCSLS